MFVPSCFSCTKNARGRGVLLFPIYLHLSPNAQRPNRMTIAAPGVAHLGELLRLGLRGHVKALHLHLRPEPRTPRERALRADLNRRLRRRCAGCDRTEVGSHLLLFLTTKHPRRSSPSAVRVGNWVPLCARSNGSESESGGWRWNTVVSRCPPSNKAFSFVDHPLFVEDEISLWIFFQGPCSTFLCREGL